MSTAATVENGMYVCLSSPLLIINCTLTFFYKRYTGWTPKLKVLLGGPLSDPGPR